MKKLNLLLVKGFLLAVAFALAPIAAHATTATCPNPCENCEIPPLSGNPPIHLTEENCQIEMSRILWRAFVSMKWPADLNSDPTGVPRQRGVPSNPNSGENLLDQDGILVWQTWKQDWELFSENPTPWDSYQISKPPCDSVIAGEEEFQVKPGPEGNWAKLLFRFGNGTLLNKINQFNIGPEPTTEGEEEEFPFQSVGPLVDKNKNYIFYELRYNKEAYECITQGIPRDRCEPLHPGGVGRLETPTTTTEMPGAIVARASWYRISSDEEDHIRQTHYVKQVLHLEYDENKKKVCRQADYALIGLAINLKSQYTHSPSRPNVNRWLWGTFVPDDDVAFCREMKFSSGFHLTGHSGLPEGVMCPQMLPDYRERKAIDICQLTQNASRATSTNQRYREALVAPWNRFTQVNFLWMQGVEPNPGNRFSHPVLEVFAQDTVCTNCHNGPLLGKHDHIVSLAIERERVEKPVPDQEIYFPYGSTWIPPETVDEFCNPKPQDKP